jgi:hypothetical protein
MHSSEPSKPVSQVVRLRQNDFDNEFDDKSYPKDKTSPLPHDAVTPIVQPSAANAVADINQLTRELWDTRREITAVVAKEMRILERLRRLHALAPGNGNTPTHKENSGALPPIFSQRSHSLADQITALVTTSRIMVLEAMLGAERTRVQVLEEMLKNERRRRLETEAALEDVERECREPFVVPALLESFIAISKLTGESLP